MTELITASDIYLQDIICDAVGENPKADDIAIYNKIYNLIDVESLDQMQKILRLIRLNKNAFNAS